MPKEELILEIERLREYLNHLIDKRTDYEEILESSQRLDGLIVSFMQTAE